MESPNPQDQGRFGERSAPAGDIDGDGVGDFFMSAFQENVGAATLAGRVYLFSGRTRTVIRSFASPEPQNDQRFGFTVSSPGDLTGDGERDLVVGADVHDDTIAGTTYLNTGKAWAYNGATGALLYPLSNPDPQSNPELPFSKVFGFGVGISSAGDMTGDRIPEILVGASSNDIPRGCGGTAGPGAIPPTPSCRRDQGQGYVFNGANGAHIRTYTIPDGDLPPTPGCNTDLAGPGIGTCGFLGFAAAGVGDVNRDGFIDHQLDAGTYDGPNGTVPNKDGRIYVFSGNPAEPQRVLLRIDSPIGDQGRIFGLQTVDPGAPGDVNKDGFDDIYGNCFQCANTAGEGGGRAWIFSGQNGSILYNLLDPSPEPAGGFAFSGAGTDYDLDGSVDEFIAGQNGSGGPPPGSGGGASIFGFDVPAGPQATAPALKDFRAPPEDAAANPSGPPPANGLRFGRTVTAPGDLNGDCEPDYVVGAPHTDVGPNPDQGRVYVFLSRAPSSCPRPAGPPPPLPTSPGPAAFEGCPASSANVIRGTAAGGSITGTPGADRIFGGTGNDVVDALAGNDCVDLGTGDDRGQGGLGNDLMLGGLGRDRMSGSSGNDRIRGNPGNDSLDAGRGDDRAFGDAGSDLIRGGFGNDLLHGVSGNDRLSGSRGRDRINGGSGRDSISAGSSSDRVAGDAGNDRVNGNSGNDRIKGNSGNDRITGSTGRDRISGGSGKDRINARDGRGGDRISCGIGRDSVVADRGDRVSRDCERVTRRG